MKTCCISSPRGGLACRLGLVLLLLPAMFFNRACADDLIIPLSLPFDSETMTSPDLGCEGKIDLVFLIDASWSIDKETFRDIREFAINLYANMIASLEDPADMAAGVILYASTVYENDMLHLAGGQNVDVPDFLAGFNKSTSNIRTNTSGGLEAAMIMFDEEGTNDATKILLFITDGKSDNTVETTQVARRLSTTDINVFAVGVGRADKSELRAIASHNGAVFFPPSGTITSDNFRERIARDMCSETHYHLDPDRFSAVPADIYFLFDETVSDTHYDVMKDFTKNIIESFVVGEDAALFGVYSYQEMVFPYFEPDMYSYTLGLPCIKLKIIVVYIPSFVVGEDATLFGVYGYSEMVFPYFEPGTFKLESTLHQAINEIERPILVPNGHDINMTLTWLLKQVQENGDPDRAQIGVLFITDQWTVNPWLAARRLKENGIGLFVVALGGPDSGWREDMRDLVWRPSLTILDESFSAITLDDRDSENSPSQLNLQHITSSLHAIANGSLVIGVPDGRWRAACDVLFMIDGSASYNKMIEFSLTKYVIAEMINTFMLGVDTCRVGVMVFDSISVYEEIPLGGYRDRTHLLQQLEGLINIERTTTADNLIAMEAAIEHFEKHPRDAVKVCYLFTTSSASHLLLGQVTHHTAHVTHGIVMRPVYIGRGDSPPVPAEGEMFDGQIFVVIDQESAYTLGSSQTQTMLNEIIKEDVEIGPRAYNVWTYDFDLIVLIQDTLNQTAVREFLAGLVSRFAMAGREGMLLGVVTYGEDDSGRLTYATKIRLGDSGDLSEELQDLTVSSTEGVNTDKGVMDLASVYKKRGRQSANSLALILMEDTANMHKDLQAAVDSAKEKGVEFLTVGLGKGSYIEQLEALASSPELAFPMDTMAMTPALETAIIALATDTSLPSPSSPYLRTESVCSGKSGIVFIIDASARSGSVMEQVKAFVTSLIDGFDLSAVEIGVLGYDGNGVVADTVIQLGQYTRFAHLYQRFMTNVGTNSGSPGTAGYIGIRTMTDMFRKKYYDNKIAVFFTYGISAMEYSLTEQAIRVAEGDDIEVVVVSTADDALHNSVQLQTLADDRTVLEIGKDALNGSDNLQEVHDLLCNSLSGIVAKCERAMDLILVVDASISIDPSDFNLLKLSLWKFMERFNMGLDLTRIGIVLIGDGDNDFAFNLSESVSENTIKLSMVRLTSNEIVTNTAAAMQRMVRMFEEEGRDLMTYPRIAIVYSDGKSSNTHQTMVQSVMAHLKHILVEVIGLGDNAIVHELEAISSRGSPLDIYTDYEDLYADAGHIAGHICQVAQDYTPPDTTDPGVFTCGHTMDIAVVRDLEGSKDSARFTEFLSKLKNNFAASSIDVFTTSSRRSGRLLTRLREAIDQLSGQTPRQSTRLLILITDRSLSRSDKGRLDTAADDAKSQGILMLVYDARTRGPNGIEKLATTADLYFRTSGFVPTQELEISSCISSCPAGRQRVVDDGVYSCQKCDRNLYRDPSKSFFCVQCPNGMVTKGKGATSVQDCAHPSGTDNDGGSTNPVNPTDPDTSEGIADLEDGVCSGKMDLIFIVDTSLSVDPGEVATLNGFINQVAFSLSTGLDNDDINIGVIQFNKEATAVLNLTECTGTSSVTSSTLNRATESGTNTPDALKLGIDMMIDESRSESNDGSVRKTCVLIMDDKTPPEYEAAILQQTARAQAELLRLLVIGIWPVFSESDGLLREMKSISSDSESWLYFSSYIGLMTSVESTVLPKVCEDDFTCSKDVVLHVMKDNTASSASDTTFQNHLTQFMTLLSADFGDVRQSQYSDPNHLLGIGDPSDTDKANVLVLIANSANAITSPVVSHLSGLQNSYAVAVIVADSTLDTTDFEQIASSFAFLFQTDTFSWASPYRYISRKLCIDPCPSGQEFDGNGECTPCENDTYRDASESAECLPCPSGYESPPGSDQSSDCTAIPGPTTACSSSPCLNGGTCYLAAPYVCQCTNTTTTANTGSTCATLVECPAGEVWDNFTDSCTPCLNGFYRSSSDDDCKPCPAGGATRKRGSTTPSYCTNEDCPNGQELWPSGCELCPKGYYRDTSENSHGCVSCPPGKTTSGLGTTRIQQCTGMECSKAIDVIIAVALTSNMTNQDKNDMVTCLRQFIDLFNFDDDEEDGPCFGIARYAETTEQVIKLENGCNKPKVMQEIEEEIILPGNNEFLTDSALAFDFAYKQFSKAHREDAEMALLIIQSPISVDLYKSVERENFLTAHWTGVEVTVVGKDPATVLTLASHTTSQYFFDEHDAFPPKARVGRSVCRENF